MSRIRPAALFAATALTLIAAGCAKKSPAIGTWTAKTPLGGNATLTLAEDGTGNLSAPPVMNGVAVNWKEENGKVTLQMGGKPGGGSDANAGKGGIDATLAQDGKTMTVPLPMTTLTLNKQEESK